MTKTALRSLSLFSLLLLFTTVPSFAQAPALAGAWEATATFDGSGDSVPFLATFDRDGTWNSSGSDGNTSAAHGAWERTGPRTFSTKSVIFFYDSNGQLILRGVSRSEVEVSRDGSTYSGTFEATITELDGTVLTVNTGTEAGQRITVD